MKKLLIAVVGVLTMAACGNKTKGGEAIDSTLVDSLMTDSVVLGVTDLWTVDAVEAQIRLCFDEVNKMAEADGVYINRLDSMFCSKDFLELQEQLLSKVRESQVMFDGDEGHHWLPGIGSPVTVDSIKSELLTGDQAQAEVCWRMMPGRFITGLMPMSIPSVRSSPGCSMCLTEKPMIMGTKDRI